MNINVQTIHFSANDDLHDLIDRKLKKLEKFKEYIVNGEMYLRKEGEGNTPTKLVELKINVKGNTLFAKDKNQSFEEAIDQSIAAITRQLRKHKEKTQP